MKTLLRVLLVGFVVPLMVHARENPDSYDPSPDSLEPSFRYIAQNNEEDKKSSSEEENTPSKLPPPPAPKTAITTEKPIKGALQGIIKKKITGEASSGRDDSPARADGTVSKPAVKQKAADSGKLTGTTKSSPSLKTSSARRKKPELVKEEISIFNVSTCNLRTIKPLIDDDYNLRGMVYGEEQGFIRLLEADNDGNFKEVWKSPPLNAPVRELFVEDIDMDGETEIVAYTTQGKIFIYGYQTRDLEYQTPENTYSNINCMIVTNLDDDPQLELFFIANKPGRPGKLIQFDTKTHFDEWVSTRDFFATDIVIGNVDADPEPEIILNTGEVLSVKFKNIEWESETKFGDRLYLIDLDSDGILELVSEYDQEYVRIIDVDERKEKW